MTINNLRDSANGTFVPSQNPCTLTVIHSFVEHVSLHADDPIEEFSEVGMATGSMASAGGSSKKHSRTGSEESNMDFAALLDRAADRFSACMDTKVVSMMDRLEKRIDEKIDSKLGLVMDRLSVLEKWFFFIVSQWWFFWTEQYYGRCSGSICSLSGNQGVVWISGHTHGLTEAQVREVITKLLLGIGPDHDFLIARVGAFRVRNTKIICHLENTESFKLQAKQGSNECIHREGKHKNLKLGLQGTIPFVAVEKFAWRQEQQRTFGKVLAVAEQLAIMKAK